MMSRRDVGVVSTNGASVLKSIHDADENQWNNLVTQSNRGSLFHRYEWLAAVEAGFDHDPCHALVAKDSNPIAMMPNFVSPLELPHEVASRLASQIDISVMTSARPGYGGPLVTADEHESVDHLFEAVDVAAERRTLYHLIRTYDLEYMRYGKYLQARGYEPMSDACLFFIGLEKDWETILANMDKERRKAIRDAHDQDFQVEIAPISDDLDRTYEEYLANMKRVNGNRIPRAFLEALADRLDDRVRVFTARVDGIERGRYVHLLDRENSVLHHWLSAIPEESCFEYYPSELLHARAIKWGIEHDFDDYNFGMTGSHFDNSVFRFKEKYGGRMIPLLRWQKGQSPFMWQAFKLGRSKYMGHDG